MENNNILKTCIHCKSQFKSKYYMNLHQRTQKCKLAKDKNLAHIEIVEMIKEQEREEDEEYEEYMKGLSHDYNIFDANLLAQAYLEKK